MRLLYLLARPMKDVAVEMNMNIDIYSRKAIWKTLVWEKDYWNKIRPYAEKYIDEIQEELKFLDLYFKQNDRMKQQRWPNTVSLRAKSIARRKAWEWYDRDTTSTKRAREEVRAKTKSLTRWAKRRKIKYLETEDEYL